MGKYIMVRKIYLASSWKNSLQPQLVKDLRNIGHEVYDFRNPHVGNNGFSWSSIDENWKEWTSEQFRNTLYFNKIAEKGFKNDWNGMLWADTGILLLPCGRSAHIEAGYFRGANKQLFIVLSEDQNEAELMYKMAHRLYLNTKELLNDLTVENIEYINSNKINIDNNIDKHEQYF